MVSIESHQRGKVESFRARYNSFIDYFESEAEKKKKEELIFENLEETTKTAKDARRTARYAILISIVAGGVALMALVVQLFQYLNRK